MDAIRRDLVCEGGQDIGAIGGSYASPRSPARTGRMTVEEANEFMTENKPLIHSLLKAYRGCDEYDDLFQEASIGFFKGLMTFDPKRAAARGTKLTTYCCECAKNEVRMQLRRLSAKFRSATVLSLDGLHDDPDTGKPEDFLERTLLNNDPFHPSQEDVGDRVIKKQVYDAAIEIIKTEMSPKEQLVIQDFMIGKPQSATAATLHASQANVSKTLKIAMSKLTLAMKERGLI